MKTKVAEIVQVESPRTSQLHTLMENCRNGKCQKVRIVCDGTGDAFITRYWPTLYQYVTQQRLMLTVADQFPLDALITEKLKQASRARGEQTAYKQLSQQYSDFRSAVKQPAEDRVKYVKYVDKSNAQELDWYQHLSADMVFILVPDDAHVMEARPWNKRATAVFIEKPFNRELAQATRFVEALRELEAAAGDGSYTFFFALDHYFAKIFEFVTKCDNEFIENRLGRIKRIEFKILEAGGVEPWRKESLAPGIVYDLDPHIMAMISPFVDLDRLAHDAPFLQIRVARHKNCVIKSESFAHVETKEARDPQGGRIEISGDLGKGVGSKDEKYLRLVGESGAVYCELDTKKLGRCFLEKKGTRRPFLEVYKGHPEILKTILDGGFVESPIGSLTSQEGVVILGILQEIRQRIERNKSAIATYTLGASAEKINTKATPV